MQDLSSADSVAALIDQLSKQFEWTVGPTVIASYVGTAVRDLTGSVCPEALPEMACRLASHRLAELAADRHPDDPFRTALTRTHTKGGVR